MCKKIKFCGIVKIYRKKGGDKMQNENGEVCCPMCKSTQIVANKKGFGLGKAAAEGLLLGPIGLLGGVIGSGKIVVTCLKCGHKWKV